MARHDIIIDDGGPNEVTLECEPFLWPRTLHEAIELHLTRETGWRYLDTVALAKLEAIYNGARGQVIDGLAGLLVQYVDGTGSVAFAVTDWRGNIGTFVFQPNDGLVIEEIHGSAADDDPDGSAFHTATIRLIPMSLV